MDLPFNERKGSLEAGLPMEGRRGRSFDVGSLSAHSLYEGNTRQPPYQWNMLELAKLFHVRYLI